MEPKDVSLKPDISIAIIGMGCLFPGASGLKEFWRLLSRGQDAICDVPETHWSAKDYYDKDPKKPDKVYCTRGGFLPSVDFDPSEFGIPPNSLEATDTSQLLGLVAAKAALEDAGYGPDKDFDRTKVSVILGITGTQELVIPLGARLGYPIWEKALLDSGISPEKTKEIVKRISDSYVPWQENSFPGLLGNVVAGRISNRLNLKGTNCVVDAACASSMSAIHMAVMEIMSGRSDMAVTGGVDTLNDIFMHMCFTKTPILSPTGDVRPFSENADGSILGEGVGIMVLKRLDLAKKDHDKIYAVIKGMGTSSDGKSNSIYAPRPEGQAEALAKAYENAGFSPSTVDLIEAHGTGTRVGDEVEFTALKKVFGNAKDRAAKCAVGTVKSMIGHTKAAAGAAGMIKTALALYHKVLPPTLKAEKPDPRLNIGESPFFLNRESLPWLSSPDHPRRAGVSSFGFGGSNFHVVMEEYDWNKPAISWDGSVEIMAFSGSTRDEIKKRLERLKNEMEKGLTNEEIAEKAAGTRAAFTPEAPHRLLLVLEKTLDRFKNAAGVVCTAFEAFQSNIAENIWGLKDVFYGGPCQPGRLAFVFPGQGSQYVGMGKDYFCHFPQAHKTLEAANFFSGTLGRLSDFIFPVPGKKTDYNPEFKKHREEKLKDTQIAQPAIGAVSVAMMKILKYFGIEPDATCGHSFGELSALCCAGWLNEDDFFRLAALRGKVMADSAKTGQGAMTAVKGPVDEIQRLVSHENIDVVLANKNSPDQGVLSGNIQAIEKAEEFFKARGFLCKRLPVSSAFHSRLMEKARKPFADAVKKAKITPTQTYVFSNTTGEPYPSDPDQAKKILGDHLVLPVDFVKEIKNLFNMGVRTFVEVGPKSVLSGLMKSILKGLNATVLCFDASSGRKFGISDLARLVCALAASGHRVDLEKWEEPAPLKSKKRMRIPICGANYRSPSALGNKNKEKRKKPQKFTKPAENKIKTNKPQYKLPDRKNLKQDQSNTGNSFVMNNNLKKENYAENFTAPGNNNSPAGIPDTLKVVREGLKSMQALQMQTAETHKKFLETQVKASMVLQTMMESSQRLAEISLGITPPETYGKEAGFIAQPPGYADSGENIPGPAHVLSEKEKIIKKAPDPAPAVIKQDAFTTRSYPEKPAEKTVKAKIPANNGRGKIESAMLEVVSELTGYPKDMLSLDMDIEADLGIDSIKRVEILSSFEEKMPDLPAVSPEIMGTLKTLGEIVDYLLSAKHENKKPRNIPAGETFHNTENNAGFSGDGDMEAILLEVVSELTGYPKDMLSLDMDIEADLGIDSIKRVEILSGFEEKMPGLPSVSPEIMGTLKTLGQIVEYIKGESGGNQDSSPCRPATCKKTCHPETTNTFTTDTFTTDTFATDTFATDTFPTDTKDTHGINGSKKLIEKTLLEVVSELTGYPKDMLSLDMDIEADLGIDSIKRVEILSGFEEKMPDLPSVSPEIMGTLKTLGQIVEYLSDGNKTGFSPGKGGPETSASSDLSQVPYFADAVKKKVIISQKPFEYGHFTKLPGSRPVFITKDKSGFGDFLAKEFEKKGISTVVDFPENLLKHDISLSAGLVITSFAWEKKDGSFLKDSFVLCKKAGPGLIKSGRISGAVFATITKMDGSFGFSDKGFENAFEGGLAGLAKTASAEWKDVLCHAIDIDPEWTDLSLAAKAAANEILHKGPVETGLSSEARNIPKLSGDSYPHGKITLDKNDVVLVTGGARGVTASCALALASRIPATFILMGRSPLPSSEPDWLKGLYNEPAIKKAILDNMFTEKRPTPKELENVYKKIMANREIFTNLDEFARKGAGVFYFQADVRDYDAVKAVIDKVRKDHGPVKAIVHGAGVLADRHITDKTTGQFEMVFDTKVKGFEAVMNACENDPLKYIIIFSSVAARMGNKGQVDYAMANEVLNKMARQQSYKRNNCRVISFNWGPWDGGMVSPSLRKEFQRNGIGLIPIDQGANAMIAEMGAFPKGPVEVVIGSGLERQEPDRPVKNTVQNKPGNGLSLSFKKEISIEGFPVLKSHILGGKPVVPFALMTEWLGHGALHENPGLFLFGLDEIRLLKGIRLENDKKSVRLLAGKARRKGDIYEARVELRNGIKNNSETIHLKARAILSDMPPKEPPLFNPPVDMRIKSYNTSVEDIYETILFHGRELHGIREIMNCSPKGMVAKVAAAPPPEKWMKEPLRTRWISDPLVMDSAFQMAIVWCFEQKGKVSLPSYMASYRQYVQKFPDDGVTAVLEIREAGTRKIKGDFLFMDGNDNVVAAIKGYEAVMDDSLFDKF